MNNAQLWQLAGWTMIHFLWIGALGTLVLALVRRTLRSLGPDVRYVATLLAFVALAIAPLAIAWTLYQTAELYTAEAPVTVAIDPLATAPVDLETPLAANGQAGGEPVVIDLADTSMDVPLAHAVDAEPVASAPAVLASSPQDSAADPLLAALRQVPSYLPWLWIVGTPLTLLLLATGVIGSERLRSSAEVIVQGPVFDTAQRLRTALRLSRQVTLAVTERVLQPVVVGVLRPMILLPPVALTGWSPEQLEMALVHELAHVRRWDNLVNLAQRGIEAVLFFHPCVWLVSRWLRADREHCCDAVVVKHTNQPEAYADLLIRVAREASSRRLPSAAVALSSHPLARRVRRILQLEDEPMVISKRSFSLVVIIFAAAVTMTLWRGEPTSVAEEATHEPGPSATDITASSGEPGALATGENEATTEDTEKSELHQIALHSLDDVDVNFEGEERNYRLSGNEPYEKVQEVVQRHVAAGHDVSIQSRANGGRLVVRKLNTPGSDASGSPGLPFLPLEQQRIADLAFKMMYMEVKPLTTEQRKAVAELGYSGGVMVDEVPGRGGSAMSITPGDILEGDILVGLHVWPTANMDQLGEVLRRDDLTQFNPLKYYVLRMVVDEEAIQKMQLEQQREMQEEGGEMGMENGFDRGRGEFGGGFGGEFGGRGEFGRGGGEFGGGRGGRGGFEGRGGGRVVIQEPEIPLKLQLESGRLTFSEAAWSAEQQRLARAAAKGTAERPARVYPLIGKKTTEELAEMSSGIAKANSGSNAAEKIRPGDVLKLRTMDADPEGLYNGEFTVESSGALPLGPLAGRVGVKGLTIAEAEAAIQHLLAQFYKDPKVQVVRMSRGSAATKATDPSTTATDQPVKLLYDGRTFEDWRDSFASELKPAKRAAAVTALRAFGRAGYAKEATEVILKVAEPYRFDKWGETKGEGMLVSAIVDALQGSDGAAPLPATVTVPMLAERYAQDADKYRWLLWHSLVGVRRGDGALADLLLELARPDNKDAEIRGLAFGSLMTIDSKLEDQRTRQLWARHLLSDDKQVAILAANSLLVYRMDGFGGGGRGFGTTSPPPTMRELMPEFLPQLFHANREVRANARRVLSYANDEQLGDLPKTLAMVAKDPVHSVSVGGVQLFDEDYAHAKERQIAAIRALAVMGPRVKDQQEDMADLMKSADVYEVKVAAYVAGQRMLGIATTTNNLVLGADGVPRDWSELVTEVFRLRSDDGKLDKKAMMTLGEAANRELAAYTNDATGGLGGGGGDTGGGGFF